MSPCPRDIDLKSLGLHRRAAAKIHASPELFEKVRQNLERLFTRGDLSSLPYLVRWQEILSLGMAEALSVAVEDSERGQVLRTCSPFAGILTERERLEWLGRWASQHGR